MKTLPIIINPPNPIGLDSIISKLIDSISTITFVNQSQVIEDYFDQSLILPLARLDEKTNKPVVYWKGKDYFSAAPNDNYRSVTFFYQEDPNNSSGLNQSSYNINVVHWYNQDKIGRNLNYSIKESVIASFKQRIFAFLKYEDKNTIDIFRETDTVFNKYTFTEDKTLLKYPYDAFRIRFTVTAENDCYMNMINIS